jgi:magnesium chelatase subunit I
VVRYFEGGNVLQLGENGSAATLQVFGNVPGLVDVVRELALGRDDSPGHTVAGCELVLEALVAERRVSRSDSGKYGRAPRRTPPGGATGGMKSTFEV